MGLMGLLTGAEMTQRQLHLPVQLALSEWFSVVFLLYTFGKGGQFQMIPGAILIHFIFCLKGDSLQDGMCFSILLETATQLSLSISDGITHNNTREHFNFCSFVFIDLSPP